MTNIARKAPVARKFPEIYDPGYGSGIRTDILEGVKLLRRNVALAIDVVHMKIAHTRRSMAIAEALQQPSAFYNSCVDCKGVDHVIIPVSDH